MAKITKLVAHVKVVDKLQAGIILRVKFVIIHRPENNRDKKYRVLKY